MRCFLLRIFYTMMLTATPALQAQQPTALPERAAYPLRPHIEQQLTFSPLQMSGIYKVGDTVGWTVTSEPMQAVAYHRAESQSGESSIQLDAREKYLSQLALRSHLAEVSKDRCADFTDERVVLSLALLGTLNADDLALPVDVLKARVAHLAAANAVHGYDQLHRVFPNLARRVAFTRCK